MDQKYHYDTLTNAIQMLQREGYTIDFNLKENDLLSAACPYLIEEFRIKDIYRYEGNSDPADEVVVYAIANNNGLKGTFVSGYGFAGEEHADAVLARLQK